MAAALGLAALLHASASASCWRCWPWWANFLVVSEILLFPDTLLLVVPAAGPSEMAAAASTA